MVDHRGLRNRIGDVAGTAEVGMRDAPLQASRSALCRYWPIGLLSLLLAGCAGAVPEVKAPPPVIEKQIDSFFYLRATVMYRECAVSHERPFLTIKQIAAALDACDFNTKCETDLCWQIHGDVEDSAPQAPIVLPRNVGQEYGEPIPSPPPEPNEDCHIQCGRQHCEDWLKCGRAYEGSKLLRDRCRDRVRDRHEACHKKCSPGIG